MKIFLLLTIRYIFLWKKNYFLHYTCSGLKQYAYIIISVGFLGQKFCHTVAAPLVRVSPGRNQGVSLPGLSSHLENESASKLPQVVGSLLFKS